MSLVYFLYLLCSLLSPASRSVPPIVETECGLVEGQYNGKGYAFRGIPYALPPTGNRRWKPPTPLNKNLGTCWNGTYQAFSYGKTCLQRNPDDQTGVLGSEDCLYLNVWTPTIDKTANLHVMVWIHGGYLEEFNANWPTYCPSEELAEETNIVYVGMNYRLHAFGFMALELLSEQSPSKTSGNYGFMDQIHALKWVQDNIRNFGGNPDSVNIGKHTNSLIQKLDKVIDLKVTLFGQSSGGTSITALLASKPARGLFHKAWIISGSPILNKTTEGASIDNLVFLKNTGCENITCLYQLPGEEVIRSIPWEVYPYWALLDQFDLPTKGHFDGALAVVDGDVVFSPPFQAWQNGVATDVPLLVGTTANEIDLDPVYLDMNTWTWRDYQNQVKNHLDTFGSSITDEALKLYTVNVVSPEYQYTRMGSDIRATCPTDHMTKLIGSGMKSPVYRYIITSTPSVPVKVLGMPFPSSYSLHTWDVLAFFGTIKDYIETPSASDLMFQNNIRREVLSFVQNGFPYTNSWPPYSEPNMYTALLSENTTVSSKYLYEICMFWASNGLLNYAWIN